MEETPVRDLCDSPQCLGLLVRTTNISHLFLPLSPPPPSGAFVWAWQHYSVLHTCLLKRFRAHLHDGVCVKGQDNSHKNSEFPEMVPCQVP